MNAVLFPPEKLAYTALVHLRNNCQGAFVFITKDVHPKPDWWPWFLLQLNPPEPLVLAVRTEPFGTARFSASGKVKGHPMKDELWAFTCTADAHYRERSDED